MPVSLNAAYLMAQGAGASFEVVRRNDFEVYIQGIDSVLTCQVAGLPRYTLEVGELWHMNDKTKYAMRPPIVSISSC